MAMLIGGSGGGKRGRRALSSEINVTPFVDVMLVLLIVFMITATAPQTGVDVSLPKSAADQLVMPQSQPLAVTVTADGTIYIQDTETPIEELAAQLFAIAEAGYDERIFLRGDEGGDVGRFVDVMTRIQLAGFRNIAIVTDSKAQRVGE
ncbi:MAG: biopolymer transporter ExbD [Pseudomonadota bacterium]